MNKHRWSDGGYTRNKERCLKCNVDWYEACTGGNPNSKHKQDVSITSKEYLHYVYTQTKRMEKEADCKVSDAEYEFMKLLK